MTGCRDKEGGYFPRWSSRDGRLLTEAPSGCGLAGRHLAAAGLLRAMGTELHPDERAVFEELWSALPKDQSGTLVSGAAVADVLRRGNVPVDALRALWALADTTGRGHLTEQEFYVALRYVALCQKSVTAELSAARLSIFAGMPLVPNLVDFDPTAATPATPPPATMAPPEVEGSDGGLDWGVELDNAPLVLGGVEEPSPTPSARSSVSSIAGSTRSVSGPFTPDGLSQEPSPWVVPTADRERHVQYFGTQAEPDAQTGEPVLQMDTAIQVLRMSEQPDEVLAAVWDLATFQQTVPGSLTASEFVAAMHLLTVLRQQPQLSLPASAPAELVASATGGQVAPVDPERPNVDSPRELALRAEEKTRVEAAARAKQLSETEAAQRRAEEMKLAASEQEEERRHAEEAILARSREAASSSLGVFNQQVVRNATEASGLVQGAADFGADDPFSSSPAGKAEDPFGSDSGSAQDFGETPQPRFPSVASSASSAQAVSVGADDTDLDAAFGPDDDTTTADSGPFASPPRPPAGPWPTAASRAPSVLLDAGTQSSTAIAGNKAMKPTSSAPWASPMLASPGSESRSLPRTKDVQKPPVSSARLQAADAENLQLRSQIAHLSAESSQLQSTAALEAMAAQRESENEELRSQLSKLTQEVAQNTELYNAKLAEGDMAETAQRNLREELEALEIEHHRQKHAIQRQTEINEEAVTKREALLELKADLAAKVEADKGAIEALQTEHTALAKEVKTMEVNLEYEKMAAGKLAAEVDRLRSKIDEQSYTLRDRKQSYEGHERKLRQLRDERLVLEARATQVAAGAAAVEGQRRQLQVPVLDPGAKETASQVAVAAGSESDDPFGVSDQESADSNPFVASSDEEGLVQQAHDDPFAVADVASGGPTLFDSQPALAVPFHGTPDALPPAAVADPFSSPVGVQPTSMGDRFAVRPGAQDAAAAGDHDAPFADDEDPFADGGDGGDPFTDSAFGSTVSAASPSPAPAPTGTDDNPFATADASRSPFHGIPGTGFNPFA